MAWTAPMTATLNATFTAAQWNTNVRDNMLETEAAKATTAGRYFITSASKSITERAWAGNYNNNAGTVTSTTYTNLSGTSTGPTVSVTTGTSAIVFFSAAIGNRTLGSQTFASVAVSGATTTAAADLPAIMSDGLAVSTSSDNQARLAGFCRFTLTAGVNSFTMQYRVSAGTGDVRQRTIAVMPF